MKLVQYACDSFAFASALSEQTLTMLLLWTSPCKGPQMGTTYSLGGQDLGTCIMDII